MNWHERSALQSVAVRRSTGNDVSGHYFHSYSSFHFFFSFATFSHRRSARIKKLIWQKWLEMANNLGLDPSSDPVGHFGATWGHFGFCRQCGVAGGEWGPPAPLGWYFSCFLVWVKSCFSCSGNSLWRNTWIVGNLLDEHLCTILYSPTCFL